ncbi:MAG: hypothetical protein HC769_09900 [Cyanobacteria bacterium CRU_2_1]|nr:hypothetical protein [Cyanobacteria bacterium RU_5_0]NJR59126.1 hypothetical protein [Cyanobacteria bacterium CRU_2_1]
MLNDAPGMKAIEITHHSPPRKHTNQCTAIHSGSNADIMVLLFYMEIGTLAQASPSRSLSSFPGERSDRF